MKCRRVVLLEMQPRSCGSYGEEKKNQAEKKKNSVTEIVGGRQFDREALLWPITAHESPNLK